MDPVIETEKLIKERLEASGQLAKMRAMVVEASLKALHAEADDYFSHSKALKAAKASAEGAATLQLVIEYLQSLGLAYTVSVLSMEADLGADAAKDAREKATKFFGSENSTLPLLIKNAKRQGEVPASTTAAPVEQKPATTVTKPSAVENKAAEVPAVPAAAAPTPAVVKPGKKEPPSEETLYCISRWTDREFYRQKQVAGQQVQLEYLNKCKVYVLDPLDSMTVDDCEDSEIIVAACEGSIFLRNCKRCIVTAACKQLRTRDCEYIEMRLFAATDPVVEMSHHMTFKPFNARLPGLVDSFKAARLDASVSRFVHVYDFTAEEPKLPKPHFEVLFPDHGLSMVDMCESRGKPECPPEVELLLKGEIQPASSSESGQNKSHNIKSGSGAWTAPVAVTKGPAAAAAPVPTPQKQQAAAVPVVPIPVPAAQPSAAPQKQQAAPIPLPVPVPQQPAAAPPVAAPVAAAAAAAKPAADDDKYSSFEESTSSDDKYQVDEDDDEF